MTRVTCAVIVKEGRVLATRRGPGMHQAGLWEFPGGKVRDGESDEACVAREIAEELSLVVRPIRRLAENTHCYENGPNIVLVPFLCELVGGDPAPIEHSEWRWCDADALAGLDWCPADVPIAEQAKQAVAGL